MSATNSEFIFKALTIGAVLVISFAASLFVQSVVQDRIAYQTEALEAQSGNTSSVVSAQLRSFSSIFIRETQEPQVRL